MVLHTLGQCLIRTALTSITPRADMCFAIGAYLTRQRGTRTSRRVLEAMFWPGVQAADASHRLSELIRKLRRNGVPIHADDAACIWLPRDAVSVDIETLADQPASAILSRDLSILPGYSSLAPPALRDWVDDWRNHLQLNLLDQLMVAANRAIADNQVPAARELAAHALRMDPEHEGAIAMLRPAYPRAPSETGARKDQLPSVNSRQSSVTETRAVTEGRPKASFSRRATSGESVATCVKVSSDVWASLRADYCATMSRTGAAIAPVPITVENACTAYGAAIRLARTLISLPGAAGCEPATTELFTRCFAVESKDAASAYSSSGSPAGPPDIEIAIVDLIQAVCDEQPLVILVEPEVTIDLESRKLFASLPEAIPHSLWLIVVGGENECAAWSIAGGLFNLLSMVEKLDMGSSPGTILARGFSGQPLLNERTVANQRSYAPAQRRLSAISGPALQVLQAIGILGGQATVGILRDVLRLETHILFSALEELGRTHLASPERSSQPDAKDIMHLDNEVRAAVLETISTHGARLLHLESAQVLEHRARSHPSAELYWECAEHWAVGGEPQRAAAARIASTELLREAGRLDECLGRSREILSMVDAPPLRALALRTLAFTQHAARDWLSLGQSVADVRQIEQCCSASASVHDDLELCSLNARRYSSREQGETLRLAKECISSLAANPAHRVAAAIIALKVATNVGDLDGMDEIHASIGPYRDHPSVSAANRITLLMIYHAIRGDSATAAILARDLLGIVQTSLSPVHQLVPLMDCAGALRRAGAPGEACHIYKDIFELAKKSHVMDMAADAAHRCIEISCDAADFATASEWTDRYYATTAAYRGGSVHYSLRVAIARVRISERNWREADELLEPEGCAPLWSDPVAMFRNSAIAVKLRLEIERGTTADEIDKWVHKLAKSHASLRDTGAQDYEAYSLFLGYRAIGDAASAIETLQSYVASQRRDTIPLCAEIQTALANYA